MFVFVFVSVYVNVFCVCAPVVKFSLLIMYIVQGIT